MYINAKTKLDQNQIQVDLLLLLISGGTFQAMDAIFIGRRLTSAIPNGEELAPNYYILSILTLIVMTIVSQIVNMIVGNFQGRPIVFFPDIPMRFLTFMSHFTTYLTVAAK